MPVMDSTFGTFFDGGDLQLGDIVVGLRNGLNTRFNFQELGIYLPLAGGTMSGAINMDDNSITGLPLPTLPSDAATKAYIDSLTAPVGAAGTFLRSNGTDWLASAATIPNTTTINQILYSSANNTIAGLSTLASGVLVTSAGGVPSIATTLPSGLTIPGYQATITPAALTRTNDTNITLTLGGTPATALLQAVSLTLGWTGSLSVPRGGTGNTTFTAYSVLCAGTTATGAFQNVSGVGTLGQVLTSNGAAALPTWQSVSGAGTVNAGSINQLAYYAANGTAVSGLATANSGLLMTDSGGVPVLQSTGTGINTFLTTPTSANLAAALTDEVGSGKAVFGEAWDSAAINITLVGGTGNVTPQYTTSQVRWSKAAKVGYFDYYANADGGNEGAGTGRINFELPGGLSVSNGVNYFGSVGYYVNGATKGDLWIDFGASTTTFSLVKSDLTNFTGDDQNDPNRTIRLHLFCEIA